MVTPLMVEFLRNDFDQPELLKKDGKYLITYGQNAPPRQFGSPLGAAEFLDLLGCLRYREGNTSQTAIRQLQEHATQILGLPQILALPEITCADLLQIDLVTEIGELWPIPFEAVLDQCGNPLLLNPGRKVVLTRRRRVGSVLPRSTWDPHPRILFAWANPSWTNLDAPPHEQHLDALKNALRPWSEPLPGHPDATPGLEKYLTVIENASEEDIARACAEAQNKNKPFGYVHILAHGQRIEDARGTHRDCIGVCLESPTCVPTTPESLSAAIHAGNAHPSVVTLAVCSGAEHSNAIVPGRSLAQELHCSGVPIVVASQLPLTFSGSTALMRFLYPEMLKGEDIRETLFGVRHRLFRESPKTHDWLSVVAYVRLPEDYDEVRAWRCVAAKLGGLKTKQYWTDYLLETNASDQAFEEVANRLSEDIDSLAKDVQTNVFKNNQPLLLEVLGLLGSAHKRRAELLFRWKPEQHKQSRDHLCESRDWYTKANRTNLCHHWTGVQALSAHAVLDSRIDYGWWSGTVFAAKLESENDDVDVEKRMWACGTLAELQLLAPCTGQKHDGALDLACEYLQRMKKAVYKDKTCGAFLIESTRRQLSRYVNWWTRPNGYFLDLESDLAGEASRLIQELDVPPDQRTRKT